MRDGAAGARVYGPPWPPIVSPVGSAPRRESRRAGKRRGRGLSSRASQKPYAATATSDTPRTTASIIMPGLSMRCATNRRPTALRSFAVQPRHRRTVPQSGRAVRTPRRPRPGLGRARVRALGLIPECPSVMAHCATAQATSSHDGPRSGNSRPVMWHASWTHPPPMNDASRFPLHPTGRTRDSAHDGGQPRGDDVPLFVLAPVRHRGDALRRAAVHATVRREHGARPS